MLAPFYIDNPSVKTVARCKLNDCQEDSHKHLDDTTLRAAQFWFTSRNINISSLSPKNISEFLAANPDRDNWIVKPLADGYRLTPLALSERENLVFAAITPLIQVFYENGLGLRGTALKNYTSGDHQDSGFEYIVESCIRRAASALGHTDYEIEQNYFRPTLKDGDLDPMRLDQHVWVRGQLVGLIENRAWIDKPFYELKRNVIQTFETLPHTRRHITSRTSYLFLGLNIDITNRLIRTQNLVYEPRNKIHLIALSEGRRNPKMNYFDNGLSTTGVMHFSRFLSGLFVET
jgi:hypothetical protein